MLRMSKVKRIFVVIGSVYFFSLTARGAVDHYSWGSPRIRENRGEIRLQFEPQGALARSLSPGFQSAYRTTGRVDAAFGVAHWLTVFVQARWALQTLNSVVNYGFTDQTLGAHWRLFQSQSQHTQIGLQTQADLPFFYLRPLAAGSGLPDLGDGSFDGSGHLFWWQKWAEIRSWPGESADFLSTVGVGGTYRSHFFSASVPWSVLLEVAPRERGLALAAFLHGQVSLRTDPYVAGSIERPTTGSGGTFWTYAPNPSWISVGGNLGYRFSRHFSLQAAFQQGVWAMNAPLLSSAALQLQFRLGGGSSATDEKSNRGFSSYDFTTRVIRVRDSEHQVVIRQSGNEGVAIGQLFDIFKEQGERLNQSAIARGKVSSVQLKEAVIDVEEYFQESILNPQAVARRLLWRPN